jgi:membrane protease YdiL (CAAX protease family)
LLVFDSRLLSGSDILRYGVIWLVGFLMVGLLEEYMTRGYLQFTLTRGLAGLYQAIFKTRHSEALGFWTSALIFSILFGLGHRGNPGESPIGLLSAGSAGLVSGALARSGGRSASILLGTGPNHFSMACRTAASWFSITCWLRIPLASPFSAEEPPDLRAAYTSLPSSRSLPSSLS